MVSLSYKSLSILLDGVKLGDTTYPVPELPLSLPSLTCRSLSILLDGFELGDTIYPVPELSSPLPPLPNL